MSADDTSREALVERVATDLRASAWRYHHPDLPVPVLDRQRAVSGRYWREQAAALVDAVVMPLIEERHRLRHQADVAERDRHLAWRAMDSARAEKGAAIKRAEAAEAERDRLAAEKARWQAEGAVSALRQAAKKGEKEKNDE